MFLILLGLILNLQIIGAVQKENQTQKVNTAEAFNPGDVIMEHVGDSYFWHIVSIKNFDLTIPLPVILYSKINGFHVFFSSKFGHEAEQSYSGFQIAKEGDNKGKIIEIQPDGSLKRPIDISITKNVLSLFISLILMLWIFISIAKRYENNPDKAPKGIQSLLEPLIVFVRDDIGIPSLGKDRYEKYMPYLLTVFFFIFLNNLLGLIPIFPGGANVTGNIAVTLVLALITFIITMVSTNKYFWIHMVNTPGVPWWLKLPIPLMPFIEFSSSIIIRPFVLMIRLFANILAGHINVLSFIMLIFIFGAMKPAAGFGCSAFSVAFVVFIYFIELLVAFIQAYVFTLLSALYFGMARESSHH
jgi:F-type H+-transporting ATPase subunit a